MVPPQPCLVELTLDTDPDAWSAAGFAVTERECQVGSVRLRFKDSSERGGIAGWTLSGLPAETDLDGLPTRFVDAPPQPPAPGATHPNAISAIDHVVVFSSDLERTTGAFEDAGVRCRRVREASAPDGSPMRQAFFRFGPVIIEVVEVPSERAGAVGAHLWGITFETPELERTLAEMGEAMVGEPRDAVQPGRRIATIRKRAGLGFPVALISPQPGA